jgi:hypothetical protein
VENLRQAFLKTCGKNQQHSFPQPPKVLLLASFENTFQRVIASSVGASGRPIAKLLLRRFIHWGEAQFSFLKADHQNKYILILALKFFCRDSNKSVSITILWLDLLFYIQF